MKIELIPVIEITYYNELNPPDKGPYWEFPKEWNEYTKLRLKKAGFNSTMNSYNPGSSFFEATKIPKDNLEKLISDWFKDYNGKNIDEILPFYGGYVMKLNNDNIYFPQCCGDLGDIIYWEQLIKEKKNVNYNGHPSPIISFSNSEVKFEFNEDEEEFCPPTPQEIIVEINLLEKAFEQTLSVLKQFERNILKTNKHLEYKLTAEEFVNILIYRNQELENKASA